MAEISLADKIVAQATEMPSIGGRSKSASGIMSRKVIDAGSEDYDIQQYISDYLGTIREERTPMSFDAYQGEDIDARVDTMDAQLERGSMSELTGGTYYQEDGAIAQGSYYDVATRLSGDLMRDFDLTKEQAAGLVGNLAYETGNFKYAQEIAPTVKGSRGGYGIAQWTGPRREAFESWATSQGLDLSSYEANYGYLKKELSSKDAVIGDIGMNTIAKLKEAGTVEDATELVSDYYLRPGKPNITKRLSSAAGVYSLL